MAVQAKEPFQRPRVQVKRTKIINDPIHGSIEVNHLCMLIIDTPQFQRLRQIKQLGGCYYVYPGATHNRFEHSIGVYHLAGEFARRLQRKHPDRNITKEDILCVEIAGLCHDLGHGPFSHVFEKEFMRKMRNHEKWKHEDASVKMFEFLLEDNPQVNEELKKQLPLDKYVTFIKELINPPKYNGEGYPFKGQEPEKGFLYEIVSNSRNGIDVDKWDYFARDCHMLGFKNNFDHIRCMKFARVINVADKRPGEFQGWQICMRDKEATNLYDMFHTRQTLHRSAYKHKDTIAVELMIVDAMKFADQYQGQPENRSSSLGPIPGRIADCKDDMKVYLHLTDSIFDFIMHSPATTDNMKKAKDLLSSILKRKMYKCVAQALQRNGKPLQPEDGERIQKEKSNQPLQPEDDERIQKAIITCNSEHRDRLYEDDIMICIVAFDYGSKDKNPLENVRFYSKSDEKKAEFLPDREVSKMLPSTFEERVVLVYCKHADDKTRKLTADYFDNWCRTSSDPKMEKPKIWL